ncbi:MAG: hypothetical protein P1U57_06895, partial [Oleibacter sp.]|nr:hypothetical protein [Thalassolituus sp.]
QHALDMSSRPHQLIREASRTLVSGGYIVIVGFNPISWWGALRWTRNLSPKLPWASNPVSPMRLNDWLTLLDFRIEDTTSAAHVWPLKIGPESACRRVDRVMAGITIPPGNIHMVLARKTVAGMTTIRPRARVVAEPVSGLAVSTACSFEQVDSNK